MKRWLFLFCWVVAHCLNGQTPAVPQLAFRHLNTRNGLSGAVNPDLVAASDGLLWISSWDGLNCFDGLNCTTFRRTDGFFNARIWGVLEDKAGNLWFGTESLGRFEKSTGRFTFHFPGEKGAKDFLVPFYIDERQHIWMHAGSIEGILCFEPENNRFRRVTRQVGKRPIAAVQAAPGFRQVDTIWCADENLPGLMRIVLPQNGPMERTMFFDGAGKLPRLNNPRHIFPRGDVIWIAAREGLVRYEWKTGNCRVFNDFGQRQYDNFCWIEPDGDRLWVGTRGHGLFLFDPSTARFLAHWVHDPTDPESISGNDIQAIQADTHGNLRVSVVFKGVDWCNPGIRQFKSLLANETDRRIWWSRLAEDDQGYVWFARPFQGVSVIDPVADRLVRHFRAEPGGLPSNKVMDLFRAQNGWIWIATERGLCYFDPAANRIVRLRSPRFLKTPELLCLQQLADGTIYTSDGQVIYWLQAPLPGKSSSEWTFVPVQFVGGEVHAYYWDRILELPDGKIMLSTVKTMKVFERTSAAVWSWKQDLLPTDGMYKALLPDPLDKRKVWVVMQGSVQSLNLADRSFSGNRMSFPAGNAVSPQTALADQQGRIWVGSSAGLWLSRKPGEAAQLYSYQHGLRSIEFVERAALTLRSGAMVFGTTDGLVCFFPEKIRQYGHIPDIFLKEIQVNDAALYTAGTAGVVREMHLPYEKNTLAFYFSAVEFAIPEANRLQYRLDGFEKQWVEASNPGMARYPNLPQGKYRFLVRAANPEGIWREKEHEIAVHIDPPWWRTWWFRLLVLLAFAGAVWWLFRLRTQRLLQRQRAEMEKHEALERERARIARDMHDDLGSGLSAIHLISNYAQNRAEDPVLKREMEKIAASSKTLNQNIREIIWAVNTADDSLASLTHFLRRYCYDFSETSPIDIRFIAPEILPDKTLSGELRRNLFLCVKEALNNAAKYAGATRIEVEIILTAHQLEIVVSDNGNGFDLEKARQKGGNGLRNIRNRMTDIGGNAHFSSGKTGTVLRLTVETVQAPGNM